MIHVAVLFATPSRKSIATVLALAMIGLAGALTRSQENPTARDRLAAVTLTILDQKGGLPTPARVELQNDQGVAYIADDAISIGGDCSFPAVAWKGTPEQWHARLATHVLDPLSGLKHFHSAGKSRLSLPVGNYRLRVFKGNEYLIAERTFAITQNPAQDITVELARWADLASEGWYSSESHLHISRPTPDVNASISTWMQAEDIHVANLLQNGNSRLFHACPQYAHGAAGLYRQGDYLVAAAQENPRTPFLGHAMILNASEPINFPNDYLNYRLFWEEAQRQGALSGRCHFGKANVSSKQSPVGLAIDLPDKLLSFVEIVQGDTGLYDFWYDALNMGFRLTPIAGTDYPCMRALPGRERFYVHCDGPFSYSAWVEGIRRGRTFATNGPVLELTVDRKQIGDELLLAAPRNVMIEARVRFDPTRDDVQQLEIVENGAVIQTFPGSADASEIRCRFEYHAGQTAWLAARIQGTKKGELPSRRLARLAPSLAHTAPIYITLDGAPKLEAHPRAKAAAIRWIESLDELAGLLSLDNYPKLAGPVSQSDSVSLDLIKQDRESLLNRIEKARSWYHGLVK